MIDLNDYEGKNVAIFNDGNAGIVKNVKIKVVAKSAADPEKYPDYKLIASDGKGEVNEGFYYQDDPSSNSFKKYQGPKLLNLYKGVVLKGADDHREILFDSPRAALDQIMKEVAQKSKGVFYKVAVTYGTTQRPKAYLQFKSFGSFIVPMDSGKELSLSSSDNLERATSSVKMTPTSTIRRTVDNPQASPDDGVDKLPF